MHIIRVGKWGEVEVRLSVEECQTLAQACRRHAVEVDGEVEQVRTEGLASSFEALGLAATLQVAGMPCMWAQEWPFPFEVDLRPVEMGVG